MGLLSLLTEDLARLGKTLHRVYGEKTPSMAELKSKFAAWSSETYGHEEAPRGMAFSNPPSPTAAEAQRVYSEVKLEVDRFVAELRRDHGEAYVDDLIRRWRS